MKHFHSAVFWTIAILCWSSSSLAVNSALTGITPSAFLTNSTVITFEFVSDTSDAYFMCSLDYQEAVHCTSPWTYKNLTDGKHHFRVNANSPTAGVDTVGSIHDWQIDTVAPITSLNPGSLGQDDYSVQLISNEIRSTFVCSLDGSPAFSCTSPHNLTGLAPGHHTFTAFAIDEAGNRDTKGADFQFDVISRIPMVTTITRVAPSSQYTNITHVSFEFVANQPVSGFVCRLAGSQTPCTSPFSYAGLPDANHLFSVHAVDPFGKIDPIGASYTWTVDTTPPLGTITRLDTTSTIVTISWTTNEPATTELTWGLGSTLNRSAGGNPALTTNHSVQITGLSSNTPYIVQPWGVDRAGNPFQMTAYSVRTKR